MKKILLPLLLLCQATSALFSQSQIKDTDGNTSVRTEALPNEDIIRFRTAGAEVFRIKGNRFEPLNTSNSIFIGEDAGRVDDGTNNQNLFVGYRAGYNNTSGASNIAIGRSAMLSNITGNNNLAIGPNALANNTTGNNNAAIGNLALGSNNTGIRNTAMGFLALAGNTTANNNAAFGSQAGLTTSTGANNLFLGTNAGLYNTTGSNNTLAGYQAGQRNTSGYGNVAIGPFAAYQNTTISNLVAVGDSALFNNGVGAGFLEGIWNTALGSKAMFSNTKGSLNTATGYQALYANTTGFANTATGREALRQNTMGNFNSAHGNAALYNNINGNDNTANGSAALLANSSGSRNTATGGNSLSANTGGSDNTALGFEALNTNTTGSGNVGIGQGTGNTSATNLFSTFVGFDADYTVGSLPDVWYSTALGNGARVTEDNQVRIGNTGIGSIGGYQNWTNLSDGRYKKAVREDVGGLDFVKKLRPVTYQLDVEGLGRHLKESVPAGGQPPRGTPKDHIRFSGFIAQEVEAAAKEMGYDFSGVDKPQNPEGLYGLRYAEFTVPLVKAVQELSLVNDALKTQNDELAAQFPAQNEKIATLESKMAAVDHLVVQYEDLKSKINANASDIRALRNDMNRCCQTHEVSWQAPPLQNGNQAWLGQNQPNPFTQQTTIHYYLPEGSRHASLQIQADNGRLLKETVLTGSGPGSVTIQTSDLAPGAYRYALMLDGKVMDVKTMVVAR